MRLFNRIADFTICAANISPRPGSEQSISILAA
jgi:hypothetical protein